MEQQSGCEKADRSGQADEERHLDARPSLRFDHRLDFEETVFA